MIPMDTVKTRLIIQVDTMLVGIPYRALRFDLLTLRHRVWEVMRLCIKV